MTDAPTTPTPRRERARLATIEEIKATAMALMREQHSTDVTFTGIAKQMGLTPPALYRYFDGRDELLTALITDTYDELGRHIAQALTAVPAADTWERWVAAGQAYRGWAQQEPERFALILGLPVPGYVAEEEGPTTEAAKRAMSQLAGLFLEAKANGVLRPPLLDEIGPALTACASEKHPEMHGFDADPASQLDPAHFQAMMHAWTGLHGFTSLEAYGHLSFLGDAARDELFASQLELIARSAGLPTPARAGSPA